MGIVTVRLHYSNFWYLQSHRMVFDRMLTGLQEHCLGFFFKKCCAGKVSDRRKTMLEYIINTYNVEN
jgi:hypothetical protein